jgi:hypothetical protein
VGSAPYNHYSPGVGLRLFRVRPGDGGHHAVAVLWPGAADGDDVKPVGACFEGAHDRGCDAHHVPQPEIEHLVIEKYSPGSGDDDVGLLLLAMTVRHRAAHVRGVAEVADPKISGLQVLAAKAALDSGSTIADRVFDLQKVHDGKTGHTISSDSADGEVRPLT